MTTEQQKVTDRLIKQWEYEIEVMHGASRVIELDYVIAMLAKLKQVACGFIYDDKKVHHYIKCNKYDLLVSMFKNGELSDKPKVVIWGSFRAELDRIASSLEQSNISYVRFYGKYKKDRISARKQFRDKRNIRVFLGQSDMGVGMNELVVSDCAVYFSNSLKAISRTQSEGRIRRIGSEKHSNITYFDLVTERSIEVKIHQDVRKHIHTAAWIVSQLRQGVPLKSLL